MRSKRDKPIHWAFDTTSSREKNCLKRKVIAPSIVCQKSKTLQCCYNQIWESWDLESRAFQTAPNYDMTDSIIRDSMFSLSVYLSFCPSIDTGHDQRLQTQVQTTLNAPQIIISDSIHIWAVIVGHSIMRLDGSCSQVMSLSRRSY